MHPQKGAEPLGQPAGEVISRFRDDVDEVAAFVTVIRLLSGIGEGLTTLVSVAVMLRINAQVTVAASLPLLAVVLIARAAGHRVERYRSRSRAAAGRVTAALGEVFGMAQTIKLAGTETQAAAYLDRLHDRRRQEAVRDRLFDEALRSVFVHSANLGTGLVVLLAAGAMRAGTFTVGDFALFSAYLSRVALFTGVAGDLLARWRQVQVSLGRMIALVEGTEPAQLTEPAGLDPEVQPPAAGTAAAGSRERLRRLEVRGLTCRHPSGRGVEGIDLTLEPGSLTLITGRVGSGKSTLLRALLGLLPRQAGEIYWNGQPARRRPGCLCASRSCWSLTICPARWTRRPSNCSGSGCGSRARPPAWVSPAGGRRCRRPAESLC